MVVILHEDDVGAHRGTRHRRPHRLHRAARRHVGGADGRPRARDDGAANIEGCEVVLCDAVAVRSRTNVSDLIERRGSTVRGEREVRG